MRQELINFLKECLNNQEINENSNLENTVSLDYVIERLKDILLNDDLKD